MNWFSSRFNILLISSLIIMSITSLIIIPKSSSLTPSHRDIQVQISPMSTMNHKIEAEVIINDQKIGLEVAKTPEQQALGLMYRTSLDDNRGMLFSFDPPRPTRFWMKNCLINLDMIFLREGIVQAIFADVPPCKTDPCPNYGPEGLIDQVIEIRGGRAKELGLKVGDPLPIQFVKPI